MNNFVELVLTCSDRQEAEKIADALLKKRLIACAKFVPVDSKYHWQGKVETGREILLMMESLAENFSQIEAETTKLHSYDTFVLKQLPIDCISAKATAWLQDSINKTGKI